MEKEIEETRKPTQQEKQASFDEARADWLCAYMNGELPNLYQMHISQDHNKQLTADQQIMMGKLIQAGIAAKMLLSTIDDSIHIQDSVSACTDSVVERLSLRGIVPTQMERKQLRKLRQIAADGEQARNLFAEKNLGLVSMLAGRRKRGKSAPINDFEDVVAEGKVGLMVAIDRFDPTRGTMFSTPATCWINQHIYSYLDSKTQTIYMPSHMNSRYKNILTAHNALAAIYNNDSEITDERMSDWLHEHSSSKAGRSITADQIREARQLRRETISYDVPIGESNDGSRSLADIIESDEDIAEDVVGTLGSIERFDALVALIGDSRKREILRDWYMCGDQDECVILSNVSRKHCLTRERVKQLKTEAEKELRSKLAGYAK